MAKPKLTTEIYFRGEYSEARHIFGEGPITIDDYILPKAKLIRFIRKDDSAIEKAQRPKGTTKDSELELVVQEKKVTEIKLIVRV